MYALPNSKIETASSAEHVSSSTNPRNAPPYQTDEILAFLSVTSVFLSSTLWIMVHIAKLSA
jgi:hypothetical protein